MLIIKISQSFLFTSPELVAAQPSHTSPASNWLTTYRLDNQRQKVSMKNLMRDFCVFCIFSTILHVWLVVSPQLTTIMVNSMLLRWEGFLIFIDGQHYQFVSLFTLQYTLLLDKVTISRQIPTCIVWLFVK